VPSPVIPPPVGAAIPPPVGAAVPPPAGIGLKPPAGHGAATPAYMQPQQPAKQPEKKPAEPAKPVFVDTEPVIDTKAIAARRWMIRVCLILAIPVLGVGFCIGKSSPDWNLAERSREDATTLLEKLNKTGPVLEEIQSKTAAALNKAGSNEVDEDFVGFIEEKCQERPFQMGDVDRNNFLVFEPTTVDKLYDFAQLVDRVFADLGIHRNFTRQDVNAIKNAGFMGEKANQVVLGAVLMNIYDDVYGADIGVVSNPGLDSDRNKTLDVQARAGRPSDPLKVYTKGSFGDKASGWVIPLDPAITGPGGPLEGAEESHSEAYNRRLTKLNERLNKAIKMHGELVSELNAIVN
jgi:hypothetical protein